MKIHAWVAVALAIATLPASGEDRPGKDVPAVETLPPIRGCFKLMGEGQEVDGQNLLKQHPPAKLRPEAVTVLSAKDADARTVLGAAIFLSSDEARKGAPKGEDLPPAVRKRIAAGDVKVEDKAVLYEALGALSDPSDIAALDKSVRRDEATVARGAARGFMRSRVASSLGRLISIAEEALRDVGLMTGAEGDAAKVRSAMLVETLRDTARSPRAAELVDAMRTSSASPELLQVLAEVKTVEAIKKLVDLGHQWFESPEGAVRAVAVQLLVKGEDPDLAKYVAKAVADGTPAVRIQGIAAVEHYRMREQYPVLVALLEDADDGVRGAAHATLKRISKLKFTGKRSNWEAWLKAEMKEDR